MAKRSVLILALGVLSCISGYLLSKASLVGRVGISLFYREYKFLKIWWQGALLVFVVYCILLLVQTGVQKRTTSKIAGAVQLTAIVIALLGLYFTYADFRHTTTHRWLGERFHIGGYLFWLGWIIISLFCLLQTGKRNSSLPVSVTKRAAS